MASFLKNFKSNYIFKIFANNIPYIKFLKIINHNKLFQKKIGITSEYYKKVSAVNMIIDPSYELEKYYTYFKINTKNNSERKMDINEWILFCCLNSSNFNIKLNISNKKFENIINYAYKINLIINIDTINFLENSNNKIKEHIYNLLIKNKNHIVEITICNIKLKAKYIIYILDLLCIIFKDGDTYNKSNIKKFNFQGNCSKDNIKLFFDEIGNIISIPKISLNIDYTGLCKQHEDEINNYICKNFSTLKSLTLKKKKDIDNIIFDGNYKIKNEDIIIIFEKLFNVKENNIEILDLSNYPLHISILELFNSKFNLIYLKELKLKLFKDYINVNKNDLNRWNFILKITNTLEVFELSIEEIQLKFIHIMYGHIYMANQILNFNFCHSRNCNNLISALNKVKFLKKLKLDINLESEVFIKFNNFNNIEYLSVTLADFPEFMNEYFIKFKNIKNLEIFNKHGDNINFDLEIINSTLILNKNKLDLIRNFSVKFINDNIKDYRQLIYYYLIYFKSLKRLSLSGNLEKGLSSIFKVIPSLCEMNIKMNLDKDYLQFFEDLKKKITPNIMMITLSSLDESIILSA